MHRPAFRDLGGVRRSLQPFNGLPRPGMIGRSQRPRGPQQMKLRLIGRFALLVLAAGPALADEPSVLAPGASPELLQEQGAGEGPAWHPSLGLLTSGGGDIVRRDLGGKVSVYRQGGG